MFEKLPIITKFYYALDAKFSISPFGIYRPGHPEGMPSPIVGFDPYSGIYADAKAWLLVNFS